MNAQERHEAVIKAMGVLSTLTELVKRIDPPPGSGSPGYIHDPKTDSAVEPKSVALDYLAMTNDVLVTWSNYERDKLR